MNGVLVDVTRCVGCGSCAVACKLYNGLNWDEASPAIGEEAALSAANWTAVRTYGMERDNKQSVLRFVKKQCLHCLDPACASACFVGAFRKTPEGPVVYNERICVGCRYCMLACPFSIPKYEWDALFPRVRKCQMCFPRIKQGEMPACAGACPTEALKFGKREELLQEARARIAAEPNKYVNHIYGEKEYGGTSWLYISDVPFEQLGFNTNVSKESVPHWTGRVTKWTLPIAAGWSAILTALYLYTRRRAEAEDGH